MKSKYETRQAFLLDLRDALDGVEPVVRTALDDEAARVEVLRPEHIETLEWAWQSARLHWPSAVKKCRSIAKSCFVGVRVRGQVSILFLLCVSPGHVNTKLLFVEKDTAAVVKGAAMALVDIILGAVAAWFESQWIVIDKPLPEVVSYYEQYGYGVMKRRGREAATMAKMAKIQ